MKQILTMLAAMLAVCVALADTWTDPETGIEWTYTVSEGKASVGSGDWDGDRAVPTSTVGIVTIPTMLGGYPVTGIGDYAFYDCDELTSVKIPNSVTNIGEGALCYCDGITSITIPDSITRIYEFTFCYCTNLTNVTIPDGVMSIGYAAFQGCGALVSIALPKSVRSISYSAFYGCYMLRSFIVDEENQDYSSGNGFLLTKDGSTIVTACGVSGDVTIPSGVTSIGYYSFAWHNNGITSITIPNSVTNIAQGAFKSCNWLTSLPIPSSVTEIGNDVFAWCNGLTNVIIPSHVTSIGYDAFRDCKELKSVTIPSSVVSIDPWAFCYCCELTHFFVDDRNEKYRSMDGHLLSKDGKTLVHGIGRGVVKIPFGVATIASGAFDGCSKLSRITIPNSVTSIEFVSFADCSGLTSVMIPESVTSIGWLAFDRCNGLTNIVFGGNAPKVDDSFKGVSSGCTATVYEGTTGWGDGDTWQGLKLIYRKRIFPIVDDDATADEIAVALDGSADAKLAVCITNAANYNAYRGWAETIGAQAVKDSPNAWVSFALGSDKLLEAPPTDEDLTVEKFEPSSEAGKFDFTVSVEGVEVGSDAQKENLKQVFGLEGAASLGPDAFSSGNVDLTFGTPEGGKVKFTAGPKDTNASTFFMKVKVNP